MGLFGSVRDSGLMASVNRELLHRIVGMEILYYRLSLEQSPSTIYDETTDKVYFEPVVLSCYVAKQPVETEDTAVGIIETLQMATFGFLREELERLPLVIQVGDIIRWDTGFYEVDNVRKEDYWWGRNPQEFVPADRGAVPPQGWAYAILADAHRSAITSVNIVNQRSGINPLSSPANKLKGF